jgi:hypothetical protein
MFRLVVVVVALLQYPMLAQQLQPNDRGMQAQIEASASAELSEITGETTTADKTDLGQPARFDEALVALLRQERFEKLDLLADQARASKSRFAGGGWKLYGIYMVLANTECGPKDDEWEPCIARINRWIASRPQSVAAHIVLAMVYKRYAFAGPIVGVGPEEAAAASAALSKRVLGRLDRASEALDQASALNSRDPQILVVRIQLAQLREYERPRGSERPALEALLEKAFLEPGYYYTFQEYALSMLGEEANVTARFVASIADRLGGAAGDIVYFHVAHTLCDHDSEYRNALSWWRIERGYEATEAEYGTLPVKLNWLCRLATLKDEQLAAAKLFDRIGDDWDPRTWSSQTEFETMRDLAQSMRRFDDPRASDIARAAYREYNERAAEFVRKKYGKRIVGCFTTTHHEVPNDFNVYVRVTASGEETDSSLFDHAVGLCLVELGNYSLPPPPKGLVDGDGGLWLRIAIHD